MFAGITGQPLPADALNEFRRLAHDGMLPQGWTGGHVSGWGMYARCEEVAAVHIRSSVDARVDPLYEEAAATIQALKGRRVFMAHLRRASRGSVKVSNNHPFVVNGRAFMHNGSVKLKAIPLPGNVKPVGETDSEKLFLMLLEGFEDGDALRTVQSLARKVGERATSMTFLMNDGGSLYAYRHYSRNGAYYTLYYALSEGSVFFASEPFLKGLSWRLIRNRSLVRASWINGRAVLEELGKA